MKKFLNKKEKGFSLIVSVSIVSMIVVGVVLAFLSLSQSAISGSFVFEKSNKAQTLADACIEVALQEIRTLETFTGTDTLAIGEGDCTYDVSDDGGENRTIESEAIVDDVYFRVRVVVDIINPQISIVSWEDVIDF
ncbi:type II secretion system protein [Patescibacteria group bacterium]